MANSFEKGDGVIRPEEKVFERKQNLKRALGLGGNLEKEKAQFERQRDLKNALGLGPFVEKTKEKVFYLSEGETERLLKVNTKDAKDKKWLEEKGIPLDSKIIIVQLANGKKYDVTVGAELENSK